MKYIALCVVLLSSLFSFSQEHGRAYTLDAQYFYGSILEHNPNISHLITDHPTGFILSFNEKTFGFDDWESRYGYPDVGYSFIYQDLKNEYLGDSYGVYAHYNFYALNRQLMMRIGQGLAYNSNPYQKENNHRNTAYGSSLLSSTYLLLQYNKQNLFEGFGLQAGIGLIHYSNANFKAPNNSTNTMTFSLGVNYSLDADQYPDYIPKKASEKFTEPIKYNLALRSGINESDVIGMGQYWFYVASAYADKRLSNSSAIQVGIDFFDSKFLKELIYYDSVAYPENEINPNTDHKRVGLFVGHELFINQLSIEAQLGYYLYYPYDFEGRFYNRIGLKRYFGARYFGTISLKAHGAKAEAVEFGIGVRL